MITFLLIMEREPKKSPAEREQDQLPVEPQGPPIDKTDERKQRHAEAQRRWRKNHPEAHRAEVAAWRLRNREKYLDSQRAWREAKKHEREKIDRTQGE
jgi:hypothetical protein